jgi:hypothetical protein
VSDRAGDWLAAARPLLGSVGSVGSVGPVGSVGSLGSVPALGNSFVCRVCLGPVHEGFADCPGCHELFAGGGAPPWLGVTVVPMTSALNPGPWYSRLLTYKRGNPEHAPLLGALASAYLAEHSRHLERLLGGAPTLLTLVPSKRRVSFAEQPLRQALAAPATLPLPLVETLVHLGGGKRHRYTPEIFGPARASLFERRIVLIEDTWVTGATALSAAGALMNEGAESVCIVPIARCIDASFWGEGHPYREAMKLAYDIRQWPR